MTGVLAVVIARAGSRGLPGKNARLIAGRPMIAWSIDAARAASGVDDVLVTTDCPTVAAASRELGVRVVDRPAELADDHATVDSAVRHAVDEAGSDADVVVILYGNVPVRPAGLVERAVRTLRETGADSVQSYAPVGKHHPMWMVRLDDDGAVTPWEAARIYRRQDLPPAFIPDGGVIAVTRESLFRVDPDEPHAFLGTDRRGVITDIGAVIDIDEPADLARAEIALRAARQEAGAS